MTDPNSIQLSDQDVEIMKSLQGDARMPVVEIARRLGVAESTVRARLNRLVANEVVQFVATSNPAALGYKVWVMIGLEVDIAHVDKIAEQLAQEEQVYFVAMCTGGHDLMLAALFRSNEEFVEFLTRRLGTIEGFRKATSYNYLKVYKRRVNFLPDVG